MRSGGNNFDYFSKNKLTKLANLIQFKRMLMSCLGDWGAGPPALPLSLCTPLTTSTTNQQILSIQVVRHKSASNRRRLGYNKFTAFQHVKMLCSLSQNLFSNKLAASRTIVECRPVHSRNVYKLYM